MIILFEKLELSAASDEQFPDLAFVLPDLSLRAKSEIRLTGL